ncbi:MULTISPECIES: P-type conjugative transfer protein TrbG [Hyphomonas]|jgi:type IV secretion system protein VirB9|uniref:Conjugative transfer protein TrbG n=1 Tax=Hyphomonas chukchiensis TaxID=1280947 RepID=A0A062U9R5_9PROT|nr:MULTISPECIES: P-type conjugative transfer protein TrbG [Hyphomonas]KCZ57091.1 conjugative transfer protein TrbG [Hyphomonas chukchiensis]MAN89305.1 P-type conjugative transfer protein TrbG [Hyphomonadaceae bacterium]HAQ76210.1 P-type conjugative transfer protein TrbG [Hyphomonas sp.]|tara:strand:- start:13070 stop:14068 length:999 start_codon:yes stop_codon:yes gene_type:complete
MIRTLVIIGALVSLGACASTNPHDNFVLDDAEFMEAVYLADDPNGEPLIIERIEPLAMAGQLKPLTESPIAAVPELKPYEAIDEANRSAAVEPDATSFINAIQIYPYTIGALYQVYTAPEQVTDIALQPGEELMSVSAGDTVRWVLGDTVSGSGDASQTHILVKPIASGLKTNLIITTSKRTYHIEMTSYRETYMAAVSWRYPHEELVTARGNAARRQAQGRTVIDRGLSLDRINFRYEIKGDEPHWRPLRAFDDGRKVYIQFPSRLDQGEAPPLFVVGRNGDSQLVNYRINGSYYIIDRLFAVAELRLGEDDQEVVRIERTAAPRNWMAGL